MVLGINCESSKLNSWAYLVDCEVGSLPYSYLELPVSHNPRSVSLLDFSKGGRL